MWNFFFPQYSYGAYFFNQKTFRVHADIGYQKLQKQVEKCNWASHCNSSKLIHFLWCFEKDNDIQFTSWNVFFCVGKKCLFFAWEKNVFFLRGKKMSFSEGIVPEGKTSDGDILFLVVREACASLHNGASDWGPPENPWTSRIIWCRMAERVFQLGPI